MNTSRYSILILLLVLFILSIVLLLLKNKEGYNRGLLDNIDLNRLINKANEAADYLKRNPQGAISSVFKHPENKPIKEVAEFIVKYAKYNVVNIEVCREPVKEGVQIMMNLLSGGRLTDRMKEQGIPSIFHLFLNVTIMNFNTGDMVQFCIEKNDVVEIKPLRDKSNMQCKHVNLKNEITFGKFMNDAINIHPKLCKSPFWTYDASNNNCQIFVLSLLEGSDLATFEIIDFIDQDAEQMLQGLGFAKDVSRKLTDLAANFRQFIYGYG
jgi:hypothetical protein